jgi:hypothetical protein
MPTAQAPLLPSRIAVVFPARRCGTGIWPDGDWPRTYTATVTLAQAGFPDLAGTPGTLTLRDTAVALYATPAGPATNKANLDALALRIATDLVRWRSAGLDLVYNGVVAPGASGLADVVEFTYLHRDQSTRVASRPWGGEPAEYGHQDGTAAGCQAQAGGDPNDDRAPRVLVDIPGGTGTASLRGEILLHDGRLFKSFLGTKLLGCGCVTGPCKLCVHATDYCNGAGLAGTFTVKRSGSTVGTCTTLSTGLSTGQCCVDLPGSATYDWTFVPTLSGYVNQSGSVAVGCPTTVTLTIRMFKATFVNVTGTVIGCLNASTGANVGVPGATVTLPGFGSTTTGGSGTFTFTNVPPGTYAGTVTDALGRYLTGNFSLTLDGCHTPAPVLVGLSPASGFACIGWSNCAYPWKTTLHLMDAAYGATTLIYNPAIPIGGGATAGGWQGMNTKPACDPAHGGLVWTATYTLWAQRQIGGVEFFVSYNYGGITFTQTSGGPTVAACPPPGEIDGSFQWGCHLNDGTAFPVTITE